MSARGEHHLAQISIVGDANLSHYSLGVLTAHKITSDTGLDDALLLFRDGLLSLLLISC